MHSLTLRLQIHASIFKRACTSILFLAAKAPLKEE